MLSAPLNSNNQPIAPTCKLCAKWCDTALEKV